MTALVLGSASCCMDDLAALEELTGPWPGIVVACNDMIALYPRHLDHAATLHPERLNAWRFRRQESGYSSDYLTWIPLHAGEPGVRTDRSLEAMQDGLSQGGSGLFALQVALKVCDRAVLCGIPVEAMGHIPDATSDPFLKEDALRFRSVWEKYMVMLAGRVKSMSGWTEATFGRPSKEWLGWT